MIARGSSSPSTAFGASTNNTGCACDRREMNCCGRCQTQSQRRCECTRIGYALESELVIVWIGFHRTRSSAPRCNVFLRGFAVARMVSRQGATLVLGQGGRKRRRFVHPTRLALADHFLCALEPSCH